MVQGTKSVTNGSEETNQTYKDRRKRRTEILKEKKKAAKQGKKEAVSCMCSQRNRTQRKDKGKPEILLMESETEKNNWILLHGDAKEIARDVWDLGKDYGLIHKGEEGEIIQELIKGPKEQEKVLQ
ncbi:hypothetical protein QL285_044780 [Trifolium repens]|jgi:hypothetical protein|nr:hypothetical protein QL285_044780 [Trifolium repens]